MNSVDLAFLSKHEGIVSQLAFLDLSAVDFDYDEGQYAFREGGGDGDLYHSSATYYLLSNTPRVEYKGFSNPPIVKTYKYVYTNDLAAAFRGMEHLLEVRLPKSLPGVGERALEECENLQRVVMPDTPTYIGDNAFRVNSFRAKGKLSDLVLPASVDSIGNYAFEGQPLQPVDFSHVIHWGLACLKLQASLHCNSILR